MKIRNITLAALIAALYSALTLALPLLSYGQVQFRFAEGLSVLPAFSPIAIWGLTIGCFISNMIGFFTGANILGAFDMVFGTLATLIAAIATYYIGKSKSKIFKLILVPFPAVIFNSIIIGLELMYLFSGGKFNLPIFLANAISVFIGQFVTCYGIGIPIMLWLNKMDS